MLIQLGRIDGGSLVRFQISDRGFMLRLNGYRWHLKPNSIEPLFSERYGDGVKRVFNAFGWRLVGMPDLIRTTKTDGESA